MPFALFMMVALSITAFPVLVGIVSDRGLDGTRLGVIATSSAAVQDGAGWVLLAVALAALKAAGDSELLRIIGETSAFLLLLMTVVRPVLHRVFARSEPGRSHDVLGLTAIAVGLFASAAATQAIGIHSILGAFFFGLICPRSATSGVAGALTTAVRPLTVAVLLPVYFLAPGLGVNLRSLSIHDAAELGIILAGACVGKMVGAGIGARVGGLPRGDILQLAVLMNTRGMVELIVLNVGLSAGALDAKLFTEMVLMAVLTTLMTGPLLDYVVRRERRLPAPVE